MQQSLENAANRLGQAIGYFIGYNFWWIFPMIAVMAVAVWFYRRRRSG